MIRKAPKAPNFAHRPSKENKSSTGFVGLRNLACICYMNAMLQQFYMTEAFRYGLLLVDEKERAENWKAVREKDGRERQVNDDILYQTQRMFAFLELSDQGEYNPVDFCYAFKDYDGQPINVGVQ